jgi:F0F1-type ATP synthase gamma subunit
LTYYKLGNSSVPAEGFKAYEMEDDVTKDLAEFSLANAIYSALVEAHAAEISARYASSFYVSSFHFYSHPFV